jgi:hypothetical protein
MAWIWSIWCKCFLLCSLSFLKVTTIQVILVSIDPHCSQLEYATNQGGTSEATAATAATSYSTPPQKGCIHHDSWPGLLTGHLLSHPTIIYYWPISLEPHQSLPCMAPTLTWLSTWMLQMLQDGDKGLSISISSIQLWLQGATSGGASEVPLKHHNINKPRFHSIAIDTFHRYHSMSIAGIVGSQIDSPL